MVNLHVGDKVYKLPESMNEMTKEQLLFLSKLVSKELPVQEIKVKMLFLCIGARARKMKNPGYYRILIGRRVVALTVDQITQFSLVFNYLFTEPDEQGRCFLDNRLTINHYPRIKVLGRQFHGSDEALTDISYNQYIYLQTYDMMKDKNPAAIYAWLGCFFLRNKEKFNPKELNLRHMRLIPADVVVLSIWFWIGSLRYIADKFPRVFPEGTGEVCNPYDGQQRLLDYVAKADPEKKRKYKQDTLYNILYSLDYLMEKDEK